MLTPSPGYGFEAFPAEIRWPRQLPMVLTSLHSLTHLGEQQPETGLAWAQRQIFPSSCRSPLGFGPPATLKDGFHYHDSTVASASSR